MYMDFEDLLLFCTFLLAVIKFVSNINNNKKR